MYQEMHGPVTPQYVLLDGGLVARQNDWSGPVAEAFAGYRWIGLVAGEVDPVLASVTDAFESAD